MPVSKIKIHPKKTPPTQQVERLAVSQREAATMLSISEKTLRNWTKTGRIKARKIDGRIIYPLDGLKEFLNADSE